MTPRCIAPVGDDDELCGRPATTSRVVEGLECPLCDECAREIDDEAAIDAGKADARMDTLSDNERIDSLPTWIDVQLESPNGPRVLVRELGGEFPGEEEILAQVAADAPGWTVHADDFSNGVRTSTGWTSYPLSRS